MVATESKSEQHNASRARETSNLFRAFESEASPRAAQVVAVPVETIRPRHSVRLKCLIPVCEYYDACKICPPRIPGVEEFKAALEDYSHAFLVVLRESIVRIQDLRHNDSIELKIAQLVSDLELIAYQHGFYLAMGLTVGGCKLCPECAPADEPCRHPFKARPSPEGFGIDITEVAREAGVPVEWPPKAFVTFLGLLLV
jgi:predicted metal-binding protein